MLLNVFSLQRFFNLRSQLSKNTFIGCRIVFGTLALIHQGDINQRHQRDCMLPLTTFVSLSIGIITVGYELGVSLCLLLPWQSFYYCSSLRMAMHLFTSRISLETRAFAPSRSPSVISSIFAIFSVE